MKILNQLVYLKKVELLSQNGLLLKFDNLPAWRNDRFNVYFTDRHHDYYECISVYFKENILNYHLHFKSIIGQQLYIEISNHYLSVWYADNFDHVEDRNTIDNLEEIEVTNFKFEKVNKTFYDWKNEYINLEKTYLDLLSKKH